MSVVTDSWSFPDLPGVMTVRETSGRASSRWNYQGRNYRRTYPIPFHRSNRKILHGLHRQFVEEILTGTYDKAPVPTITSLYEAIDEFKQAHRSSLTANSQSHFNRAFSYYFDKDLPLTYDALYRHLLLRQSETPLRPSRKKGAELERAKPLQKSTRRKYLQRVTAFCDWLVLREYLERSPMQPIAIPPRPSPRKTAEILFSPEEVTRIVLWHRRRATEVRDRVAAVQHLQHALFTSAAYELGARPSELIRMRWEDVGPTELKVWGKASPKKADGDGTGRQFGDHRNPRQCRDEHARIRTIPINQAERYKSAPSVMWDGRVAALLEELRQFEKANGGWIFNIKHTEIAKRRLFDAMDALRIERGTRSFRELRHSSRRMFEEELRFDPFTIADIFGHSAEMGLTTYRTAPSADDLARRIERIPK